MDDLLNTAPCGFVSFGDDGRIAQANATLLGMLGYERDAVVGHHVERLLTVGSRIFYQTHWFPMLRLHGRAEEIFLELLSAAGDAIGVLTNAAKRTRNGTIAYDCVLMRVLQRQKFEGELIAAKRAAEQARGELQAKSSQLAETNETLRSKSEEAERLRAAAESASRAKSTFLAVMSHELRTPLNAITGYVQLLEMEIPGPVTPEQRDILDRLGRSGRHLLRLINDLLQLARIEAGRIDLQLEELSAAELVSAVTPMIEPQLHDRQLALTIDVPASLYVRADRDKAQQLLLNLLGNAVKFTPVGGRVSISAHAASEDAGRIELRVSDTGIGIPADQLEAVFQPFVQVDTGSAHAAEGSGLGLAISRDLARGMDGDLLVESRLGEGSTFTLVLPSADVSAERS